MNSFAEIFHHWHWSNFAVIAVYLLMTTYIGKRFSQKKMTIRDFFLGGRKLPWAAVCGSIIATEISAVTFIIVPMIIYKPGGNFTYLMLAVGSILARFIIGYYFIPVYFKNEIYSPYEYMKNKLGIRSGKITSVLFISGAILGQGVRVFTIAIVLEVVFKIPLSYAVFIIGLFSILWTFMGGITTVVWTDVIQFFVFVGGALIVLAIIIYKIPGHFTTIFSAAEEAGKLKLWNFSFNVNESFTLWCGLFGTTFLTLSSHGMDQMNTQRLFCCKNVGDARKAIIYSSFGIFITVIILFVGLSLFVYYQHFTLPINYQTMLSENMSRIFPIFIINDLPNIFSGLLVAAILAAAISSLDSTLAALSQIVITEFYKPYWVKNKNEAHYLKISRILIVFWGIVLCSMALVCRPLSKNYGDIIQLALAMTSYTYGALLGTFFLAFFNTKKDDFGLLWSIPLSVLFVYAISWHNTMSSWIVYTFVLILIISWFVKGLKEKNWFIKTFLLICVSLLILLVNTGCFSITNNQYYFHIIFPWNFNLISNNHEFFQIAWPWNFPLGVAITFFVGYLIGRKKSG